MRQPTAEQPRGWHRPPADAYHGTHLGAPRRRSWSPPPTLQPPRATEAAAPRRPLRDADLARLRGRWRGARSSSSTASPTAHAGRRPCGGLIHGDEPAGTRVVDRLWGSHCPPTRSLAGVDPDGQATGTRGNAAGVDLNRDFPDLWAPSRSARRLRRPNAASETETRAFVALFGEIDPSVVVVLHQPLDGVDTYRMKSPPWCGASRRIRPARRRASPAAASPRHRSPLVRFRAPRRHRHGRAPRSPCRRPARPGRPRDPRRRVRMGDQPKLPGRRPLAHSPTQMLRRVRRAAARFSALGFPYEAAVALRRRPGGRFPTARRARPSSTAWSPGP